MSREGSTIATTCAIAGSLIAGRAHDRRTVASEFNMSVASADRHLRALLSVPGVVAVKQGKRLLVTFSFSKALGSRGL